MPLNTYNATTFEYAVGACARIQMLFTNAVADLIANDRLGSDYNRLALLAIALERAAARVAEKCCPEKLAYTRERVRIADMAEEG